MAPLRYWARVDVVAFVKCLLPAPFFELLYRYDELNSVRDMMELENSMRWIDLREARENAAHKKRRKKSIHSQNFNSSHVNHSNEINYLRDKKPYFKKGMACWVQIVDIASQVIHVKTIQHKLSGTIDIRTLLRDSVHIKDLSIHQKRKVFVNSYEPTTQKLTFSFKLSRTNRHDKKQAYRKTNKKGSTELKSSNITEDNSSIHVLNSMFKKKKRNS